MFLNKPAAFSAILFCLYILTLDTNCLSQSRKYLVYKGHKEIGVLTINKKNISDEEHFRIESDATFRVVFEFSTQFTMDAVFKAGKLKSSYTKNILNDSERESTLIELENGRYKRVIDGEDLDYLEIKHPEYSMAHLYYKEPKNMSEVFSERFGEFLSIKEINPSEYELTLPDGRTNIYTYKNGRCSEVKVNHMLATLYFKLVQ